MKIQIKTVDQIRLMRAAGLVVADALAAMRAAVAIGVTTRELDAIAESAVCEGLMARYGRKILEVLPPVGSHKGTAVRRLLEERGLHRALAAGDDTTDIDSFAALDGLDLAVRVAVASAEAPSALLDAADIRVESTDEFLSLLRRL